MSIIVKGGGGSTAKELVNSTGTKLADLEKAGSGKVKVVGGLGNTPPEKVLQGSIYSDESGVRRTGTMEDITLDLNTQSDLIKEIRAMLVGRVTEANTKPEDILKGKKAYVGEKLVTGVLEKGVDLLGLFGCTKMSADKAVFSSETSNFEANHSLGVAPKCTIVSCAQKTPMPQSTDSRLYYLLAVDGKHSYRLAYNGAQGTSNASTNGTVSAASVKFNGVKPFIGTEYIIYTFA